MREQKSSLRARLLELRDNRLPGKERKEKSSRIASQFINDLLLPAGVRSVGLYYPIRGEVDTMPIFEFSLANGFECMFPRVVSHDEMKFYPVKSKKNLVKRAFGIYEPRVEPARLENGKVPEVVIVPGVAFDARNYRVGYGKGFYDRYLSIHKPLLTVGLGFQLQLITNIEPDEWDIKLDLVLTEKGWQGNFKNIFVGGSR